MKKSGKRHFLFAASGIGFAAIAVIAWPRPFQGTWHQSGGDAEFAWQRTSSYRFHRYRAKGYPPLEESGWYWVANQEGNAYTLKVWIPGHRGEAGRIEAHVLRIIDGARGEINGFQASR